MLHFLHKLEAACVDSAELAFRSNLGADPSWFDRLAQGAKYPMDREWLRPLPCEISILAPRESMDGLDIGSLERVVRRNHSGRSRVGLLDESGYFLVMEITAGRRAVNVKTRKA